MHEVFYGVQLLFELAFPDEVDLEDICVVLVGAGVDESGDSVGLALLSSVWEDPGPCHSPQHDDVTNSYKKQFRTFSNHNLNSGPATRARN